MYCLGGRLGIRYYSSCIRAKVFHRLSKKEKKKRENNIQKYTTHISPKICHCPGTEVFIFLKAPSHKERTDTMWGRPSHPAPGAAPQGAIGINIQKPVMGGAGSPRAE